MTGARPNYTTNAASPQSPYDGAELAAGAIIIPKPSNNGNAPQAAEPLPGRFTPIPADDLDKIPPLDWYRKGEIPKQGFGGIYGPTGAGKSFYTFDVAAEVAQTVPVVYVAAEGAAGYAARKLVWCKHNAKGAGSLWFVAEAVNLLDPAVVAAFVAAVKPLAPALIIFDTLARCMIGGDENSAQSMGLAIASCDDIRNATGATVFVVHHSGKAGGVERGSSALRGAADVWLSLASDDDLITLTADKIKDGTPFEPRALRLVTLETGRTLADGDPETSCVLLPSDRVITTGLVTANGRKLLETLALETFKEAGAKASTLIEMTRIPSTTFYRTISGLLRDGFVRQHEKGDPFYLATRGELFLSPTTPTGLPRE